MAVWQEKNGIAEVSMAGAFTPKKVHQHAVER